MSATTPTEDDEIHDLVLLFANAKIPRGSDAFQSIIDDLLPKDEESDSTDSNVSQTDKAQKLLEPSGAESKGKTRKAVRMVSPKHQVHWSDERSDDKLSASPTPNKLHSARIYMKTTPKPILKHEDNAIIVDNVPQGQG